MVDNFNCKVKPLCHSFIPSSMSYCSIFNWNIENYSICVHDDENNIIISPTFSIGCFKKVKWFLSITVVKDEQECFISCFLNREKDDSQIEEIVLDFEIGFRTREQWDIYPHLFTFENQSFLKEDFLEGIASMRMGNIYSNAVSNNNLSIYCRISNIRFGKVDKNIDLYHETFSYANNPAPSNAYLKTIVCTNHCTFKWVVETTKSPNWNKQKIFYIPEVSPLKVRLTCRKNFVSVEIFRLKVWPYLNLLAFLSLSYLGVNGIVRNTINSSYFFGMKDWEDVWNFDAFLMADFETATPCETQKLTFIFDFSASNGIIQYLGDIFQYDLPSSYPNADYFFQSISFLKEDLCNLSMYEDSCDMTFIVDGDKFQAHRSVIEIRLPVVIDRINQEHIVEISDVDSSTFSIMLNYVYTGNVTDITYDNYSKLLVAANKYKLIHLLSVCKMYLINNLGNLNIIEAFQIVDEKSELNDLKEIVFKYMSRNRDFIGSKEWNNLAKTGNTKLSNRILKMINTYK